MLALALFIVQAAVPDGIETERLFILIMQDNRPVEIVSSAAILKRAPFSIIVMLEADDMLYANASENPAIYSRALRGESMAKVLEQDGRWMGGAEGLFNPDRHIDLKTDETQWQSWYASGSDDHRFDDVYRQNDRYLCVRSVENFTIDYKNLTEIKMYPGRYLYLVMTQITISDDYQEFSDRATFAVQISFE